MYLLLIQTYIVIFKGGGVLRFTFKIWLDWICGSLKIQIGHRGGTGKSTKIWFGLHPYVAFHIIAL